MAADDAQNLFDHYDTYWFTHQIFKKTQHTHPQTHINQQSIFQIKDQDQDQDQDLDFPGINTNDNNLSADSTKQLQSDSPNSVLLNPYSPKLETIFSGKEARDITILEKEEKEASLKLKKPLEIRRPKNSRKSKSLSELEVEELKGFMDLGFMFSEKDKDSKLVSIIPGLQRLGKMDCKDDDDVVSSRPYLSEAWRDEFDNKKEVQPLIRIPDFGNEVEIKDQLKFWAHSVAASVVR